MFGPSYGWTQYNYTVSNNNSPAFPAVPLTKIPSAQDALADSPLGDVSSNYDINANSYMLTSNGTGPKGVLGGAGGIGDGNDSIAFTTGTIAADQAKLRAGLAVGEVIGPTSGSYIVPLNTTVTGILYQTPGDSTTPIVGVTTSGPIPTTPNGPSGVVFTFTRPVTDYVSTALVNLWYTWANYYVSNLTQVNPNAQNQTDVQGMVVQDPTKPGATNNVLLLNSANTNLVPGMVVTGPGISTNPVDGKTTIISIDPDNRTIHLSQGLVPGAKSSPGMGYNFTLPSMSALAGYDPKTVQILTPFTPTATSSVPNVLQFAQNAYQLLSFMGQVPADTSPTAPPVSVQVLHNVIGGNVTKPTNLDGLHKIEVAFRDMVKSLLRGVNDFNVQTDQSLWYPDPSTATGGQPFNIFNLDPFVWFVHKQLGLSGYGFSLDDDAADIGAIYATKLAVSIGGLNGLPNQVEWTQQAPFGPVSGTATVKSLNTPQPPFNQLYQIAGVPTNVYYSVTPLDTKNATPAALVSGVGVSPGTFLNAFGDQGLGATSYALANSTNGTPPLTSPLQVGSVSQFTFYGAGTPNTSPLTVTQGVVTPTGSPYVNNSTVTIDSGSTLKITPNANSGNTTSYTQDLQQFTRVLGASTPSPSTIVNGTLDAGRIDIAEGVLAGTGTIIDGPIDVMGPVAGYSYVNSLKQAVTIEPTKGGTLLPGNPDGTPGMLTVGSSTTPEDVTMYGATFAVNAKGATTAGTDYSQLFSYGKVNLGNSKLVVTLVNGYTPKAGDTLTIISAMGGISGTFSQGTSITVGGFHFKISYNANSVVLTAQ